jgi:diguanylate cyclase
MHMASANDVAPDQRRGHFLVRRVYLPRAVGTALCALAVLATLWERPLHPLVAPLTLYFVGVWPHLARYWAMRAQDPLRAEKINLWIDSAHAGLCIAVIGFSIVPSVSLVLATSLSNATVGGWRFLLRGLSGHASGVALGLGIWGLHWQPHSSLAAQLGSVPLLLVYPLLMGWLMYRLASRLKESRRELRYLSEHDALSGVRNRRYFDQHLRQVFSQFQRHERQLSLLVCDVDHFKHVNDRHGHAAGDAVIRHFAVALSQCARAGDVVARLGGDEFVALLSDTDAEHAFHYARRVQERLCAQLAGSPALADVTVSFGVAMARSGMKDHEQWLEQADKALYRCKAQDRGGVCLSDPVPPNVPRTR